MKRYRMVAVNNQQISHHTWKKGMDYIVSEQESTFILASDEGVIEFPNSQKEEVLKDFLPVQKHIHQLMKERNVLKKSTEGLAQLTYYTGEVIVNQKQTAEAVLKELESYGGEYQMVCGVSLAAIERIDRFSFVEDVC